MSTDTELATVKIDEAAILRHLGLNPREASAQALVVVCRRYGLDPILKHALLIKGNLYVTRDGLLHVAHRGGQLDGIEVLEQSENASHFIAKVAVYRKDMSHAFSYVGRYPKNGSNKGYGPEMAVKVAEVMALRRAFDVSLAAREEMWDQLEEAGPAPAPGPSQAVVKTAALPPQEESGGQPHGTAPSGSSPTSWETIAAAVSNTSRGNKINKNRVLSVTVPVLLARDAMPEKELRYDHIANLDEDVLQEVVKRLGLNQQEMAAK